MSVRNSSFGSLGLKNTIISALKDLNYQDPLPIQLKCIPYLLSGRDVLGFAQTGSGKTAAFALPLLQNINCKLMFTQVLILVPTRELAIQISAVCSFFSKYINGMYVVSLYGGQRYDVQFRCLKKGAHVIVATPGRLLDHLNRGTLNLSRLNCLVLDEADEMLRMGFISDVESILSKIPVNHQTALFCATLPIKIRRIVHRFMKNPKEIFINSRLSICSDIKQYYCIIHSARKIEMLMRFLEVENYDAVVVFVRTKRSTFEINEILEKNGYNSAALNGDMSQFLRAQTLEKFKIGNLDILIATDVAARGLDINRISLVINYDFPLDIESYIHRVGRTGRAGQVGRSLLFVTSHERKLLRNIEQKIKFSISKICFPSSSDLRLCRLQKFFSQIRVQLQSSDLDVYLQLLSEVKSAIKFDIDNLAAVFLKMIHGSQRLVSSFSNLTNKKISQFCNKKDKCIAKQDVHKKHNSELYNNQKNNTTNFLFSKDSYSNYVHMNNNNTMGLYRIEIGRKHGVKVFHIIRAIVNISNIDPNCIGTIRLFSFYSTIELPKEIFNKILLKFDNLYVLNKSVSIQFLGNVCF